ncbi:hypothetical protein O9K51_11073 [Purpureocillium lavendulum]|uniref:DDE-1 domain-containing protein n=1 Tax=Purpureocillium lavendulum TaxID=1247861 RepID=A0AB34FAL9_9HYPO|nr:hypothetical protein O9K51_11073 [Purpureocillium lavendulum]
MFWKTRLATVSSQGTTLRYLTKNAVTILGNRYRCRSIGLPIDIDIDLSVTAVEAISAAGKCIPSFLILPGVQIPVRWVENELDGDTILTTSPKGYINDIIAIEWIKHFEKHTRPADPSETRVLLMDSCTNHHTEELVHFCHDHGIELFPLPPHLTHKLQPLDVGVFRSYKHWHQQVLYREIANGATDFSKTDFLYHLQEIRTRTFKKHTILSAWEKCGLFPYNPAVVLDQLQDALSSLTKAVDQRNLPGFVDNDIEQAKENEPATPKRSHTTETPPTIRRIDWNNVTTPSLSLLTIEQYNEYVKLRIQVSLVSEVPITPSVSHVQEKARKAAHTLALNGVTATAEMKALKDKQVRRSTLLEKTSVVGKYGPLSVHDARLRVAQDEYNRLAAQHDEEARLLKREARDEAAYIRRWLQRVRAKVRASITSTTARKAQQQGGWLKGDRRALLNSAEWLCQRYTLHRELVELDHCKRSNAIVWPRDYNAETINHAVKLVVVEAQGRVAGRKMCSLETDGVEILAVEPVDEFTDEPFVFKKEGSATSEILSEIVVQTTGFRADDALSDALNEAV